MCEIVGTMLGVMALVLWNDVFVRTTSGSKAWTETSGRRRS
jgi:hypothetical protein